MIKPPADDGAIVPAEDSYGMRFLTEVEAKAKSIYPDHSGSRDKYVREKVAEKLTELEFWLSATQRELEVRQNGS